MAEEKYAIPENPQYSEDIRKIQDTDPVSASGVINPLVQRLVENAAALQRMLENQGGTLKEAEELIQAVQEAAAAAQQTASTAQQAAETAQKTGESAQQAANTAQQTANTAQQNPQLNATMQMCQGRPPQEIFYEQCKQHGVNPDEAARKIFQMLS